VNDDRTTVLGRLTAAGISVGSLTQDQLDVLLGLGPQELDILLDIKCRLDEAGPEVQAHSEVAGGALF